MYAKLVFNRPGGLSLTIVRDNLVLRACLEDGAGNALARLVGAAASSYIFPVSDESRSLNVGCNSSLELTVAEAIRVHAACGIADSAVSAPCTSFEYRSTGAMLRDEIRRSAEILAGQTIAVSA